MSKKTAHQEYTRIKKDAQKQQQRSRKEAVCDELGYRPDEILSYREYKNNTVSVVIPDGRKYWFVVVPDVEPGLPANASEQLDSMQAGTWSVERL